MLYVAAAFKSILPLPLKVFDPRGVGKPQQMTDAENEFTEAESESEIGVI
jgi:hypothetical protein